MIDIDKLVVQKSNPLQSLYDSNFSLAELKILDVYLSRINSHNINSRSVTLAKGELEKLLGVTYLRKDDFFERLDNLFKIVTIHDTNRLKKISLFEIAQAELDNNGQWCLTLCCTPSAMEYIFNIDNIGYIRYALSSIVHLRSRYSYCLYLYLLHNCFRKSWTCSIDEIKRLLNCNSYRNYKDFNKNVLFRSCKEINEKTNIKFSYSPTGIKSRSYTSIEFTVISFDENSLKNEENPKQIFTEEQIFVFKDMANSLFIDSNYIDYYIDAIILKVKSQKGVKNPFAYAKGIIKADIDKELNGNFVFIRT